MTQIQDNRRYDIDWLRTLAFGVLILYHIGMYYVADWGWHIKSEHTSRFLQELMILTNPWRMSLLFFISAIALSLVQQRYDVWHLVKTRTSRLLIPLLFGMFVIVAPQTYYEALSQDLIQPGFINFWLDYINPNTNLLREHHSPIGLLTWNHLWFLPYLWAYCLVVLAVKSPLNRLAQSAWMQKINPVVAISVAIIILAVVWFLLRRSFPSTNALLDDWYNHGKYFSVFLFGYLLAQQNRWWQFIIDKRLAFLILAILGYTFIVADRNGAFDSLARAFQVSEPVRATYGLILSINHWAWILCVLGVAGFWLNRPSNLLSYSTQAILPWYMLHQTLIIVFAWWLKPLEIDPGFESVLLIILTTLGCFLGYEIIRRVSLLRFLCGLKVKRKQLKTMALQY